MLTSIAANHDVFIESSSSCYDVVRATSVIDLLNKNWPGRASDLLTPMLLLEHYVTTAPQRADANYLGHCLPPVLVAAVDAYLFPARPSVLSKLAADSNPLTVVAVGLASAALAQPLLPLSESVLDTIFVALDQVPERRPRHHSDDSDDSAYVLAPQSVTDVDVVRSVLVLAQRAHRLDAALFEKCVARYGLLILRAIGPLARNRVDLGVLGSLIVDYIHRSIPSLLDKVAWPDSDEWSAEYITCMGWALLLAAERLLHYLAPDSLTPFLSAWLEALPTDIFATRDFLVPLVERLPRTVAAFRPLALAVVTRYEATPPLPSIVDFGMRDVALDPTHCDDCKTVRAFLDDPNINESTFTKSGRHKRPRHA
ncbi:hypothetical protein SDRG_02565 [Saprolegnia diclina VS20]|uniref:Uncharacterized protein n=1 Tax=Saprolegnia diclina (strain VS20) TaxID=1156394 RepID=T0QP76_SAPDV|nr:hypothetical protein SDRG_02565 [Saprolegnia diclina VS20]EQC39909.1 hypothetical protein SDRG_02565 [Saprolegnia diclina VS20]|eukprot:XP_008606383.1 hypothetical protein SDRG_02565 [Saprolegnia diclina VS20]